MPRPTSRRPPSARPSRGSLALGALASILAIACGVGRPLPLSTRPPAGQVSESGEGCSCTLTRRPSTRLAPPELDRAARGPSRANLRAWVSRLADPALAGRASGSREERGAALLLARTLAAFGVRGAFEDGGFCQPFAWPGGSDQNVAGVLRRPGGGEAPIVILGAHYDGQGRCGAHGAVCPSADDNASGVAALLEAARLLATRRERLRVDVVFAFFGAEERGIVGSSHFVRSPPVPLRRVERMVNLDMVGRPLLDGQALRLLVCDPEGAFGYVVGTRDQGASEAALERAGSAAGLELYGMPESALLAAGFVSDSVPFSAHVPTLFLSTSIHDDYHGPGDTVSRVDFAQVERAVRLVLALVEGDGRSSFPARAPCDYAPERGLANE